MEATPQKNTCQETTLLNFQAITPILNEWAESVISQNDLSYNNVVKEFLIAYNYVIEYDRSYTRTLLYLYDNVLHSIRFASHYERNGQHYEEVSDPRISDFPCREYQYGLPYDYLDEKKYNLVIPVPVYFANSIITWKSNTMKNISFVSIKHVDNLDKLLKLMNINEIFAAIKSQGGKYLRTDFCKLRPVLEKQPDLEKAIRDLIEYELINFIDILIAVCLHLADKLV